MIKANKNCSLKEDALRVYLEILISYAKIAQHKLIKRVTGVIVISR